jgi:hypothetical protein
MTKKDMMADATGMIPIVGLSEAGVVAGEEGEVEDSTMTGTVGAILGESPTEGGEDTTTTSIVVPAGAAIRTDLKAEVEVMVLVPVDRPADMVNPPRIQ